MKSMNKGEPIFILKPFKGDKKERTEEAISTWLGQWEPHFGLHSKFDVVNIGDAGRELGGRVAAWSCGLQTSQNLFMTWEEFVEVFKKQFLQPHKCNNNFPSRASHSPLLRIMYIMFELISRNRILRVRNALLLALSTIFQTLIIIRLFTRKILKLSKKP